jgi:hypothetical protein
MGAADRASVTHCENDWWIQFAVVASEATPIPGRMRFATPVPAIHRHFLGASRVGSPSVSVLRGGLCNNDRKTQVAQAITSHWSHEKALHVPVSKGDNRLLLFVISPLARWERDRGHSNSQQ